MRQTCRRKARGCQVRGASHCTRDLPHCSGLQPPLPDLPGTHCVGASPGTCLSLAPLDPLSNLGCSGAVQARKGSRGQEREGEAEERSRSGVGMGGKRQGEWHGPTSLQAVTSLC